MDTEPGKIHHGLELLRRLAEAGQGATLPSVSSLSDSKLRLPPHDGGALERGVEAIVKVKKDVPTPGKPIAGT